MGRFEGKAKPGKEVQVREALEDLMKRGLIEEGFTVTSATDAFVEKDDPTSVENMRAGTKPKA